MTQSTTKRLRIEIDQVLALMIAVATGGPEIKSKQAEYAKRRQAIQQLVYEAGLEDPNPYDDLWQWYGKWSNDLPKYQDRRTYVRNLYKPLLEAIDKLEEYSVSAALKEVEHLSEIDNVPELRLHAARIRYSVEQDPAQAIGSAKELLETTLKTILSDHGAKHTGDIPTLIKRVRKELSLDTGPGGDTRKRTLSSLSQVIVGIAEMRNLYGTGHGRSRAPTADSTHARFVIDIALATSVFLFDIW